MFVAAVVSDEVEPEIALGQFAARDGEFEDPGIIETSGGDLEVAFERFMVPGQPFVLVVAQNIAAAAVIEHILEQGIVPFEEEFDRIIFPNGRFVFGRRQVR